MKKGCLTIRPGSTARLTVQGISVCAIHYDKTLHIFIKMSIKFFEVLGLNKSVKLNDKIQTTAFKICKENIVRVVLK
jgi:hypothetical protein